MSERFAGGPVELTALHSQLRGEGPEVWNPHVGGHGDPVALARALRQAFEATQTPLRAEEVKAVEAALARHGLQMTALHDHMLDEEPRLFFMHFSGTGDPVKLAAGLRAAVPQTDVSRVDKERLSLTGCLAATSTRPGPRRPKRITGAPAEALRGVLSDTERRPRRDGPVPPGPEPATADPRTTPIALPIPTYIRDQRISRRPTACALP